MKQEIKERVERIRNGGVPEGYKETKVGIIPDDWLVSLTDNVAKRGTGHTPNKKFASYYDGGIKWISLQDSNKLDNGLIFHTNVEISEEGLSNSSAVLHSKGSVLISRDAGVGKSAIMGNDMSVSQHFITWTCSNRLNNWYLYYYLQKQKSEFERMAVGSTIKTIGMPFFKKYKIPLPPIKEQKKIAKILSTWDKAIELKEKLIDEKNKFRIAIVADLLFGLKRFDEFIKSHKYNSTKYTNIPEDWEFIEIGEIATEVSEKNGNNDELPVLSCTKHSGLVDSLTYFKKRVFSKDTSTYKQVKKNQFVYATNHIDEGSIGCQNIYDNSLVSPMYTVFKTNPKVNNDFLFSLLKTRLYIFIYQVNMSASVDRRGSLRWNEFSKIRIPLPDIAEQNKIVEFIRSVDNEIELLKLELNQLKEQKRGLMQLLLTGIVRVKVD
jgi:type I restriction enzyme S subunit